MAWTDKYNRTDQVDKERRADLKKYYNKVAVCTNPKCRKLYGRDSENKQASTLCPICLPRGYKYSSPLASLEVE